MTNKLPNHFILIDKCAEETRIVEILNKKILKMSSWFDTNPSIVGDTYEAKIIKILHGGIVRARLKNDIVVSVRGVPKSYKVDSVVKIIAPQPFSFFASMFRKRPGFFQLTLPSPQS